ncbi:TetR family transcriptional regulator [Pseudoduganella eburnea]|uniref:TetR family transcriptional regulator n=1 Tax=Massilia eburnea TaxID=1776165 RepID=A0A6L6QG84_9BURK|nr:TetR/AcrR family transcriptional regulator [Massilia eburnea]MTW11120.1 TetR family transcriptional regulator [Massilia eburnea]
MTGKATRERIIEAADRLFYQQGYEQTSFADVAAAVGITRGNFYHHFKAKDEILDAVIQLRLDATAGMLARWEVAGGHPEGRLLCFVGILVANRAKIMAHGCPVGTLSTELSKLEHRSREDANKIFLLFRTWLRRQFELLGRPDDADDLAMHLLARSQGVATLANAFHDEGFIQKEVDAMRDWIKGVRTCLS